MTEQAGRLNAPDLVEECARAMRDGETARTEPDQRYRLAQWDELEPDYRQVYHDLTNDVLSVLRKRGLLTIQALELLSEK